MNRTLGLLRLMTLCAIGTSPIAAGGHPQDDTERTVVLPRWGVEPVDPPGLLDPYVLCICEDGEGYLWFGTAGGGVTRHDPQTGSWRTFTDRGTFGGGVVLSCQTMHDGDVRFEIHGRDDAEYDLRQEAMVPVPDESFDPRGQHKDRLPPDELYDEIKRRLGPDSAFVTDHVRHPAGDLWIGTYRQGVLVQDEGRDTFRQFHHPNGGSCPRTTDLLVDSRGSVWIATSCGGVSEYSYTRDEWTAHGVVDGIGAGGRDVADAVCDARGRLWFASIRSVDSSGLEYRGGLTRYDPFDYTWKTWQCLDGVEPTAVFDLHGTPYRTFLASTSVVPAEYDPDTDEWRLAPGHEPESGDRDDSSSTAAEAREQRHRDKNRAPDQAPVVTDLDGGAWRSTQASTPEGEDTNSAPSISTLTLEDQRSPGEQRPRVLDGLADETTRAALVHGSSTEVCWARPSGVLEAGGRRPSFTRLDPALDWATAIDGAPDGCWAGHLDGGLVLVRDGEVVQRWTSRRGLPSDDVLSVSQRPGAEGIDAWIGTSAGAARLTHEGVVATFDFVEGRDAAYVGSVDLVRARANGGAIVALNEFPYVDPRGDARTRRDGDAIYYLGPDGEITATADRGDHGHFLDLDEAPDGRLWLATDTGLHRLINARTSRVDLPAYYLQPTVRHVEASGAGETWTLWLTTDRQGNEPAHVFGYQPEQDRWTWVKLGDGHLEADAIDMLEIADDGHLVVMADEQLFRGRLP